MGSYSSIGNNLQYYCVPRVLYAPPNSTLRTTRLKDVDKLHVYVITIKNPFIMNKNSYLHIQKEEIIQDKQCRTLLNVWENDRLAADEVHMDSKIEEYLLDLVLGHGNGSVEPGSDLLTPGPQALAKL